MKKQYEIVKLKMNVGITDAFFCFPDNEVDRLLGLCEHIHDLTKQLREKSDFEAINQEKILVRKTSFSYLYYELYTFHILDV